MSTEYMNDVLTHKRQVAQLLQRMANELLERAIVHDDSKFSVEEFDAYARAYPLFQVVPYQSAEYQALLHSIQPAIQHHYQSNRHHPEHFTDGITGMNLLDMIEMVCDWYVASHKAGRVPDDGVTRNQERFHIGEQLFAILKNTVNAFDTVE